MRLHDWAFASESWRRQHGEEGGERNADSDVLDDVSKGRRRLHHGPQDVRRRRRRVPHQPSADQVVLVTTPEWITSTIVLDALSHLQHDLTTVAINKSYLRSADVRAVEERFRAEHLHRCVTIPYDERLAMMLDSGSYTLDALERPTRLAIKRLGLSRSSWSDACRQETAARSRP